MVSAVNQKEKLAECIQAGAIDFIVKPFEKAELAQFLRKVPRRGKLDIGNVPLNSGPTRILVVDDSALYRQSIHNVLREVAEISIVGTAKNGVEALEKIEQLDPDLLTLDVQMPDMDGIQVLQEIKRRRLRPKAIMVSSLTSEGAQVTTDALMEGAFDFILKPSSNDSLANRQQLRDALEEKISAFRESSGSRQKRIRRSLAKHHVESDDVVEAAPSPKSPCQAVIIGIFDRRARSTQGRTAEASRGARCSCARGSAHARTLYSLAGQASGRDLRTRCCRSCGQDARSLPAKRSSRPVVVKSSSNATARACWCE